MVDIVSHDDIVNKLINSNENQTILRFLNNYRFKILALKEMKQYFDIPKQYQLPLSMYNKLIAHQSIDMDDYVLCNTFDTMINYNITGDIQELINQYSYPNTNDSLIYLSGGSTNYAYRVNQHVIKISTHRFCSPKKHFRINKSLTDNVYYDIKGKPVFYLNSSYFQKQDINRITKKAIYQLFIDLRNDNLEITDPSALSYEIDNFAVLDSYKEADISGIGNYEELPEPFKENPVILIDNDLIFDRDDPNKIYLTDNQYPWKRTMDEAIELYERYERVQNSYTLK